MGYSFYDHSLRNRNVYSHRYLVIQMIWGYFKNTYELLNPRALKISMLYKNRIFECMGRIFFVWNFKDTLWNSTQNIWPIHWKMYISFAGENLRVLRFKSFNIFQIPHEHFWWKSTDYGVMVFYGVIYPCQLWSQLVIWQHHVILYTVMSGLLVSEYMFDVYEHTKSMSAIKRFLQMRALLAAHREPAGGPE